MSILDKQERLALLALLVCALAMVFTHFSRSLDSRYHKPVVQVETVQETRVSLTIVVHVTGAVISPGVYELPEGSRVVDAIQASGGFAEGAAEEHLNLAAKLSDGQRIRVPWLSEIKEGEGKALININTATAAQLQSLPGIGPAIAQRIVEYREKSGPFGRIEDLMKVSGIGPKVLANILDLVKCE
ncbi:MAG: ComEA family DNA-binding protein [Bacillota bacterium]